MLPRLTLRDVDKDDRDFSTLHNAAAGLVYQTPRLYSARVRR